MTDDEARRKVIGYWVAQARDALASARAELDAGRYNFAVNRAYYACFYVVSAVLLGRGHEFTKHSGVRAGLHRYLVKPGELEREWGEVYDVLFRLRGQADYAEFVTFARPQVEEIVQNAEQFVAEVGRLRAGS